jgi:hypothetical protein
MIVNNLDEQNRRYLLPIQAAVCLPVVGAELINPSIFEIDVQAQVLSKYF